MAEALRIGDFELRWLEGGVFELDGGTMFGVVPKVLWAKKLPPVEDNYIRLPNAPVLVKTPSALVLVDTGLGNKLTEKQKRIYRVTKEWDVPGSLAALGLAPGDVTHVVLTHLDFDHAGGVVLKRDGRRELAFPRARHIVQRAEWEDAASPNRRAAGSYWAANFEGLVQGVNLRLVDGEHTVCEGVTVHPTGGHTRGHQVVRVASGGQTALHLADLLPTHLHFNPLWVMAYDNFPLDAIARKEELERKGVEEGAWFTFYHDPFLAACTFDEKGNAVRKIEMDRT
ncbi:MAG: MBL fold metallo-hydrolase [Nitrospirota bacterium]|jgi:glyoxylase-like metal-dependent hydrolase (beta-lactamase superfamily II)